MQVVRHAGVLPRCSKKPFANTLTLAEGAQDFRLKMVSEDEMKRVYDVVAAESTEEVRDPDVSYF